MKYNITILTPPDPWGSQAEVRYEALDEIPESMKSGRVVFREPVKIAK
jgi:hypothetical protein